MIRVIFEYRLIPSTHAVASNGKDWLQADDQFERYKVEYLSAAAIERIRIRSCNEVALVADARYAGRAKEKARRIPRHPAFTGKLACIHCSPDKTTLAMWLMLDLRVSSI